MATVKTIDFSTKPVCPECGRDIPIEGIDVEKDSIWCPICHREMSFVEVADYSLVQAKRNEPLPPGFSIISDSEDSLVLSFKTARIGLRLLGLLFSIPLAILIPWVIYHMVAGHSSSYLFACGSLFVLLALETWVLLCLRNEWKLHMVFKFCPGHCSVSILPAFFKPNVREFTLDRDTSFGLAQGRIYIYSPRRPPEDMLLPFPMSGEQMFCLYSFLLDFKYGIRAGTFEVAGPKPDRKPPFMQLVPPWKRFLRWAWLVFVVAILTIRIVIAIYEFLHGKHKHQGSTERTKSMNILIQQGSPRENGITAWMAEEYRMGAFRSTNI